MAENKDNKADPKPKDPKLEALDGLLNEFDVSVELKVDAKDNTFVFIIGTKEEKEIAEREKREKFEVESTQEFQELYKDLSIDELIELKNSVVANKEKTDSMKDTNKELRKILTNLKVAFKENNPTVQKINAFVDELFRLELKLIVYKCKKIISKNVPNADILNKFLGVINGKLNNLNEFHDLQQQECKKTEKDRIPKESANSIPQTGGATESLIDILYKKYKYKMKYMQLKKYI